MATDDDEHKIVRAGEWVAVRRFEKLREATEHYAYVMVAAEEMVKKLKAQKAEHAGTIATERAASWQMRSTSDPGTSSGAPTSDTEAQRESRSWCLGLVPKARGILQRRCPERSNRL